LKIMVTGAAGFIGSHLVDRLLTEGEQVLGVDNLSSGSLANLSSARSTQTGKFSFQRVDVTSNALTDLIRRVKPGVIIHLAAHVDLPRSAKDPLTDATVNVLGTINVLEAASDVGARKVVFASSYGVYGREEGDGAAPTPYGIGKRAAHDYLRYYASVRSVAYTGLVLSDVYGPRQVPDESVEGGVVGFVAQKLLSGRPCTIHGEPDDTRDFLYVDDAAQALTAAVERADGSFIDIGSGNAVTLGEVHSRLAEMTGSRYEPIYAGGTDRGRVQRAVDVTRAAAELDWAPSTSLEEGLKQTVAWFRG
jgi:UDP-glucose 4-epimerase